MADEIERASEDSAGCWIDGHWGQYGAARMVEIASQHGWIDPAVDLAMQHLATMGPGRRFDVTCDRVLFGTDRLVDEEGRDTGYYAATSGVLGDADTRVYRYELTDEEHDALVWAADEAEAWINEHVAPEGYSFGWHDGEWFLSSTEWWEEEAY